MIMFCITIFQYGIKFSCIRQQTSTNENSTRVRLTKSIYKQIDEYLKITTNYKNDYMSSSDSFEELFDDSKSRDKKSTKSKGKEATKKKAATKKKTTQDSKSSHSKKDTKKPKSSSSSHHSSRSEHSKKSKSVSSSHSESKKSKSTTSSKSSTSSKSMKSVKEEKARKNFLDDCKKIMRTEAIEGEKDYVYVILGDGKYKLVRQKETRMYSIQSIIKALKLKGKKVEDFTQSSKIQTLIKQFMKQDNLSKDKVIQKISNGNTTIQGTYIHEHLISYVVRYFKPDDIDLISYYITSGYKAYHLEYKCIAMEMQNQNKQLREDLKKKDAKMREMYDEAKVYTIKYGSRSNSSYSNGSEGSTPIIPRGASNPNEKCIKIMTEGGVQFVTSSESYKKRGSICKFQAYYPCTIDIIGLLKNNCLIEKVGTKNMGIRNILPIYDYLTRVQRPIRIVCDDLKDEIEESGYKTTFTYSDSEESESASGGSNSVGSVGSQSESKEAITISSGSDESSSSE